MPPLCEDGEPFVLREKWIQCVPLNDILAFLTHLYGQGKEYNTIAMTKSVLSSFIHVPGGWKISQHPLIKHLLQGVFNSRPPKAKYECIWDPQLLLIYLKSLNNQKIDFKMLSIKTVALLTLLSGQRVSTVNLKYLRFKKHQRWLFLLSMIY